MPTLIRRLTPAGTQPADYTAESLADAARFEPTDGVYTITNTYDQFSVLKLAAHFDRLEESARRARIKVTLDRAAIRAALRAMIAESGFGDVRFRITIPRATPNEPLLSIEPFKPYPAELYTEGVRCITVPEGRRENPAAKTTGWMTTRSQLTESFPPGVYEGLLLTEDGYVLEGLSSNFYAILNRELRTAGEGVLPGISRLIVLEIAPAIMPVRQEAIHLNDVLGIEEAFITSASRGIVPVVEIDSSRVGDGMPGPFTRALSEAYRAWLNSHLEEL